MLLKKFPLFQAGDVQELADVFETVADARINAAKLPDRGAAFRSNSIQSQKLSLYSARSDAALDITFQPVDRIRIIFQTHRRSRIILGGKEVDSGPRAAVGPRFSVTPTSAAQSAPESLQGIWRPSLM